MKIIQTLVTVILLGCIAAIALAGTIRAVDWIMP